MKNNNQENTGRFVIGEVAGTVYWTSIAVDHLNGRLVNRVLLEMSDHQLKRLAFPDGKGNTVATERYEKAGESGTAIGIHRAVIVLQYKAAVIRAAAAEKLAEQEEMASAAPDPFKGLSYEEVKAMP